MFARLNATGEKLNHQELRNAQWFGEMKTLLYRLALEQLERWRDWGIFSDDQISRMKEVECSSDLVMNMMEGLKGKTQKRLDDLYKIYDKSLASRDEIARRFRQTMDAIETLIGRELRKKETVYRSEVYFFTLFVLVYDMTYGLGSKLKKMRSKPLRKGLARRLLEAGEEFAAERVPRDVLDAVRRASADLGRRRTRLDYLRKKCYA